MTEQERNHQELQLKIDRYGDMLFKLSFLKLQNVQDAEDVVQEVFYQYVKRQESFAGEEHEKAWLIHVTLNACRKIWRSAWNRHRSREEIWEQDCKALSGRFEEPVPGPEESLMNEEEKEMLFRAVNALPVRYREVIHLFYYEGYSTKEIAGMLHKNEATIRSCLHRGRARLKALLKEDYDFDKTV